MNAGWPHSCGRPADRSLHRLLCRCAVNVGDVQRFDINQSSDFQRTNTVGSAVGVVSTGLIAVEACFIDRGVTYAFIGRSAEKRTPRLHRNPAKLRAESNKVRKSREPNLFEDTGHFAEQINRSTI